MDRILPAVGLSNRLRLGWPSGKKLDSERRTMVTTPFGFVLLGKGWEMDVQRALSLRGWEGGISGFSLQLRNDSLRTSAQGEPAAFRLTRGRGRAKPLAGAAERPDTDFPMGCSWYYNPGTFGRDYPEQWRSFLASMRRVLVIPEPVGGKIGRASCRERV